MTSRLWCCPVPKDEPGMASKGDNLTGLDVHTLQAVSTVWTLSTALTRLSVEISASHQNTDKSEGLNGRARHEPKSGRVNTYKLFSLRVNDLSNLYVACRLYAWWHAFVSLPYHSSSISFCSCQDVE